MVPELSSASRKIAAVSVLLPAPCAKAADWVRLN
jgi:hypothetical protein